MTSSIIKHHGRFYTRAVNKKLAAEDASANEFDFVSPVKQAKVLLNIARERARSCEELNPSERASITRSYRRLLDAVDEMERTMVHYQAKVVGSTKQD